MKLMKSGIISKETIDTINRSCDIVAVVSDYVKLENRGSDWWGCCPFHSEKTPSFHVVPEKNSYYCFGCHEGGGAIKFVQEIEKISFPEAVKLLASKFAIEIIYESSFQSDFKKADDSKELYAELYDRISSSFHYILTQTESGKSALEYVKSRGLTQETIEKFRLGYAPKDRSWLFNFLKKNNYSREFLSKSGLFKKKKSETAFFADRLMFPIFDRHGKCAAFGGRLLEGEGPKYLNSSDSDQFHKGETLYAFNFAKESIRKEKRVVFCEGYMDCIAYHQCGITYAVAPLGTALTENQIKIIKSFVDTVFLSFDSDIAGQSATVRAILMCRKQGLTVKVVRLRGGKDPAEIMINYGDFALTGGINGAILDNDYLFDVLAREYKIDTPEGKTKAAQAFFPYIDALQTDIQKESSLEQFCQVFNVSTTAIYKDFYNRNKNSVSTKNNSADQQSKKINNIKPNAELRVLLAVIADSKQFELMRRELNEDYFETPVAKELFMVLEECYQNSDVSFNAILEQCDESLAKLIGSSLSKGEFSQNTAKTVEDGIRLLKRNGLKKQGDYILGRIRSLNPNLPDDKKEMEILLSEKTDIDKQLRQI